MSSSIASQPPLSLSNISTNISSNYGTTGVSIGAQSSGTTSYSTTAAHNLSPLPLRANQINTMPPLCQVLRNFFVFFLLTKIRINFFIRFFCSSLALSFVFLNYYEEAFFISFEFYLKEKSCRKSIIQVEWIDCCTKFIWMFFFNVFLNLIMKSSMSPANSFLTDLKWFKFL